VNDDTAFKRPKPSNSDLIISYHALERFKERWKPIDEYDSTPSDEQEWLDKFTTIFRASSEKTLSRVSRVRQMLNHQCQEARFFNSRVYGLQFIAIEQKDGLLIKTVISIGREYR